MKTGKCCGACSKDARDSCCEKFSTPLRVELSVEDEVFRAKVIFMEEVMSDEIANDGSLAVAYALRRAGDVLEDEALSRLSNRWA